MCKDLKECIIEESRHLVKINVYRNGNQWTFSTEGKSYVAICDEEGFVDLLRKLKAKDDKEEPRSFRSETYKQIAQEIIDGTDRTIYVWNTDLNFVWGKGSAIYKQEGVKRIKKRIKERDDFMNGTDTITIKEEFKIPGTNIVLEEGDEISIVESQLDLKYCKKQLERMIQDSENEDFLLSGKVLEFSHPDNIEFTLTDMGGELDVKLQGDGRWKTEYHYSGMKNNKWVISKGTGYEELLKLLVEDDESVGGWFDLITNYKKYL